MRGAGGGGVRGVEGEEKYDSGSTIISFKENIVRKLLRGI